MKDICDLYIMGRIDEISQRVLLCIILKNLLNASFHCLKRFLELLCNPEITSVITEWSQEHDLLNLAYVVPLFIGKVIPWDATLHIFGKKNVGIIVKLNKGHGLPLLLRKPEGLSNRLSQDRQNQVSHPIVGSILVPVIIVICVGVVTAAWCDVVMHSVFAEVTIHWDLIVLSQQIKCCVSTLIRFPILPNAQGRHLFGVLQILLSL